MLTEWYLFTQMTSTCWHAVALITHLGQRTQLVKMDLQDAYRVVQHPLAATWERLTFVNQTLSFGLRSMHKIFIAAADAIT